MNTELMQRSPLLAGLSAKELDRLVEKSREVSISAGELLIEEGGAGDSAYVILEGELEVSKRSAERDIVLSTRRAGDLIGEMALLTQAPRMASVRALQDSRLLRIPADAFERCLRSSPDATLAILRTITARLRNTEALLHQREKMAALGTLAAGLAHELNNPAAAAQRSAAQLKETLTEWLKLTFTLIEKANGEPRGEPLAGLMEKLHVEILQRSANPAPLDPLGRLEREQALQSWLEGRGLEDAWQLSPALAAPGWGLEELESYGDLLPPDEFPQLIRWLASGCLVYGLLGEVRQSTGRISQIVKAVKSYTYLDQAPIQEVDIHEGLENTLVMLRHKLKSGVNVVRQYAQDLPLVEAYASDLNQVWTNVIDNAIDAMQGQGELVLKTYLKDGHVIVEIQDSGPGIPSEIQSRIFEPFYTTKPPGSGSGLGLNIAYDIVVNKHHGEIHLTSQPGATLFQIVLPIHLEEKKS
jgi:signal transduction histidine kinase